ncbi:MAG: ATP-binding cassette domain-containing protein [Nocardiopsaceae bacterium]|nr:ATP-binding cassette domain-containing protein [Nocardiopsaceae bacterium]
MTSEPAVRPDGWKAGHAPALQVSGLKVKFGGATAIEDVAFEFGSGILGIVGPNGAGKSTVLNVLSGFIRPEEGTVRYRGRELCRLPPHSRTRLSIGRTFQDPVHAESLTVKENLYSGVRERRVPARPREMLQLLELDLWASRTVGSLPYGVRKVLDIGRALIREPSLLLCDEPMSGLDETERDRMERILGRISRQGVSLIIVEHDVTRISRLADRIVALEAGRKIADGEPGAVLSDPAVVAAFTGTDSAGEDEEGARGGDAQG